MSAQRIAILNGRLIDPGSAVDSITNLYLADGAVAGLGNPPDGFSADREIDASGLVVCPGFIDLCARLREPGSEHKGTIASETRAAAAGGITTLICPPDTHPVVDTPAVARLIRSRSQRAGYAKVEIMGALTRALEGKELTEMFALKKAGCRAVTNAQYAIGNTLVLRRAMEYAANWDLVVVIRPQDTLLKGTGCVHEGEVSSRLGLPGIPVSAETVAVAQALALTEEVGGRVHFGQLSSGRAVEMVREAHRKGYAVTADVAIHHLHLTESAAADFDANARVDPPFRSSADRAALRAAIAAGDLVAVCSDHQPHDVSAKMDAFPSTEPGIAALESLLPLMLKLVDEGVLPLPVAIARMTLGPAGVLAMPAGRLEVGSPADVCLFDAGRTWRVGSETWLSQGHNSPYWGHELTGRVIETLLAGETVFRAD